MMLHPSYKTEWRVDIGQHERKHDHRDKQPAGRGARVGTGLDLVLQIQHVYVSQYVLVSGYMTKGLTIWH